MSGRSRSSTSSSTTTVEAPFNNVDSRVIDGEAAVVGDNTNLNAVGDLTTGDIVQTDHGAVMSVQTVSLAALEAAENSVDGSLQFAESIAGDVVATLENLGVERGR